MYVYVRPHLCIDQTGIQYHVLNPEFINEEMIVGNK